MPYEAWRATLKLCPRCVMCHPDTSQVPSYMHRTFEAIFLKAGGAGSWRPPCRHCIPRLLPVVATAAACEASNAVVSVALHMLTGRLEASCIIGIYPLSSLQPWCTNHTIWYCMPCVSLHVTHNLLTIGQNWRSASQCHCSPPNPSKCQCNRPSNSW